MGRSKLNAQVSSLGDRVEGEYKKSRFFLTGAEVPGFDLLRIICS